MGTGALGGQPIFRPVRSGFSASGTGRVTSPRTITPGRVMARHPANGREPIHSVVRFL
jgi:hypothetical protein